MILAVWGSIILHAAVLAGFGLAFSENNKAFPESVPRTVTLLSTGMEGKENKSLNSEKTRTSLPAENHEQVKETSEKSKTNISKNNKSNTKITEKKLLNPNGYSTEKSREGKESVHNKEIPKENNGCQGNKQAPIEIIEPAPLNPIIPSYPFRARKKGIEGTVVLAVSISETGIPTSCTIAETSGNEDLDNAAKRAVMKSTFSPGVINGKEEKSTLRIRILFKLNN